MSVKGPKVHQMYSCKRLADYKWVWFMCPAGLSKGWSDSLLEESHGRQKEKEEDLAFSIHNLATQKCESFNT